MADAHDGQRDIGRVLCRLLPVQGAAKTLLELREQVRLVNNITDPDDDRLARVIVAYLRSPEHTRGARFLKVDGNLSPTELSARWTRVRIGAAVAKPEPGVKGDPPQPELIEKQLSAIWASCSRSIGRSFYLWDLLKEHFGVARDNNSYYRQWLLALSQALKGDPRFVMVAVDPDVRYGVEWMLAVDPQQRVRDTVRGGLARVIAFMEENDRPLHLTRDLVQRFFSPRGVDETYDVHAYYQALSKALAETEGACRTFVRERARPAEAWCLVERARSFVAQRLDSVQGWLSSMSKPQPLAAIVLECFRPVAELTSVDTLSDLVAQALGEDLRFLFLRADSAWRGVPPGPPRNLPAYHILWQERQPLPEERLRRLARRRFPTSEADLALSGDRRFVSWRADKWGLSNWVDINDWAYDYLQRVDTPCERETIVARVCYARGIAKAFAFFLPEDDPRFVEHPDGKWYYRRSLTDVQLDRIADLLRTAAEALTLDELVSSVTGLQACDTDAEMRMSEDERFVLVDGRWFAREARYSLSEEDLAALLAELERAQTGLKLATLVGRALGRDADRTDAQERLKGDARFREWLPQVWAATSLQMQEGTRVRSPNVPIRSDSLAAVPEDEYSLVEDITGRERGASRGGAQVTRKRLTRTLSLLDIQHGNLVIDRAMASLLEGSDTEAVHLTDEAGQEFMCWIDRESNLLQGLSAWFRLRRLTFGDKITLTATEQPGLLEMRPTGERDDRVHQEALRRQDLEMVVEAGRRAGKSYHDLIIEVMRRFSDSAGKGVTLHRETIYQLVDRDRTASRSYIFSLLSLPDCPYKELRYFVPHGRGFWSFDPERKRAFDMKMRELLERVQELEGENRRLAGEAAAARAGTGPDGGELEELRKQARELQTRVAALCNENECLNQGREAVEKQLAELSAQVEALQAESQSVQASIDTLTRANEALRAERDALLTAQEAQSLELERLLSEKSAIEADRRKREEETGSREAALQRELDEARTRSAELAQQLAAAKDMSSTKSAESARLAAELTLVRGALNTRLGKLFVLLSRWLGGPDLSKP